MFLFSLQKGKFPRVKRLLPVFFALAVFALSLIGCDSDPVGSGEGGGTIIGSSADLAKIGNDSKFPLSGDYELTANITLSDWIPIGSDTAPFTGTFNGRNRTITLNSFGTGVNTAKYLGIFAYTNNASISNVMVAYGVPSISGTVEQDTYIGAVAAYAKNTEFTDVKVSGTLTLTNPGSTNNVAVYGGGIAGYVTDTEFTRCVSSVAVTVTGNHNTSAGGIVGANDSTTALKTKIISSSSTGDITANWQSGGTGNWGSPYAGGIIGNSRAAFSGYGVLIENSFATGAVTCGSSQNPYAGGLAGQLQASQISASYATGNVAATESASTYNAGYVGGLAGNNSGTSIIENSYSTGNITGTGKIWAGGITGQNGSAGSIVQYCYARGTITITNTSSDTATSVGGIVGQNFTHADNDVKANAALNSAITVASGTTKVHRVVGENQTNAKVTNNIANKAMAANNFTASASEKTPGGLDGDDTTATPAWSVYSSKLGWKTSAWKNKLVGGYPVLAWQ